MFEPTSPGDIASFSIRDGYLDSIVRGMQLGLLAKADYDNLTQCDSLDGTTRLTACIYSLRHEAPTSKHNIWRLFGE